MSVSLACCVEKRKIEEGERFNIFLNCNKNHRDRNQNILSFEKIIFYILLSVFRTARYTLRLFELFY